MKRKIPFVFLLAAAFLLCTSIPSDAVGLTWTDSGTYEPSFGGTNPITYSLSFDETVDPEFFEDAVFTITTSADVGPPEWRVGWVALKFSPAGGEITDLVPSDGSWTVGSDATSVPWGAAGSPGDRTPFSGSWAGFYATDVKASDGASGGLFLTEGAVTYTFTFDFSIADPGKVFTEEIGLKVGFYDGYSGPKVKTDQLSEHLVPEPATMLLLGSGLIGLAVIGRRKFRKK